MNDTVKKAFESWASNVNWQSSHPLDENKFMDFIISTVVSGDKVVDSSSFKELCLPYYKNEDRIREHFIRYEFGVDILTRFRSRF